MRRFLRITLCPMLLLLTILNTLQAGTYPATTQPETTLKILSSTDERVMKTLIADFQQLYPQVAVEYLDRNTVPLFDLFLEEYQQGTTADLIISSAMDLQIKLVNDGYADTHSMQSLEWLPDWAQWRKQAFGFTYEPAVIVYNKRMLQGEAIPQSRFELIEKLRDQPDFFSKRVGTYDITRSGFGYLIASQDAQQASTWGRLTENLSKVKVKLYDSTSAMLNAVQNNELLLGYNVLGSYAYAASEQSDNLGIIFPSDYTLVMSRVAFVSKRANNPDQGHNFLDYLLSERGQQLLANKARLYPIHPDIKGNVTYSGLQQAAQSRGPLKLIKLGPALLTYQDRMKKQNFLQEWENVLR
ncbi:ABC transporter substrate-binding protein [Leucothrix arctica]|uniref:Iron ABC transporter substrate-binding protein n=1 Tax=Leucothrix arctica TaxID=1481894 RepID=A0A317CIR0_9GAMM|nr:ABC transporter substrate-binding protein [Leucothrix arctica]PWQ96210.1 iron ABC transporter substrate-binding protein [Leucothrix arctica]